MTGCSGAPSVNGVNRRITLVLLGISAAVLLPWTTYLGRTLPTSHLAQGWRIAWVGLDLALIVLLVGAVVLGRRRHPAATSLMTATATLLVCDAWFDVVLDWGSSGMWLSLACAAFVELPFAAVLFASGRELLSGGMARHTVTAEEIRDGRIGRWQGPVSLERPRLTSLSPADRATVDAFYDAKIQGEVRLFSWAAARHTEFAEWGAGSRSSMQLTERELERFNREYLELVLRYSMLHREPADGTRELAVRWYAFPTPEELARSAGDRPGVVAVQQAE